MNSDPNFNFNVNLAGIRAASGGGMKLIEGFYTGIVTDAFGTTSRNGRAQVAIKVTIQDEGFAGIVRTSWLGIPKGPEDGVRYYWRAALESMGYTPAQIDAGDIGISRDVLVNRPCAFYYKPGDKDMGVYEELKFLSPSDFAMQKKQFEAQASAAPAAPATSALAAPAAAPIGGGLTAAPAPSNGTPGVTKNSLLAALNRN